MTFISLFYAECHNAEFRYAECHYAYCRYAECYGAAVENDRSGDQLNHLCYESTPSMKAGNTIGGSITVPLTSCLTCLD
jgi:hypothetical protein